MSRFMRSSKFRHTFGQPYKKDQCYDEVKVTKNSWDSPLSAVNPKFLAVITEAVGGGAFIVLNLSKTGRTDRTAPRVTGHKDNVLDISWSPFNDHIIASCSVDCTVKVWEIPEGGLTEDLVEPLINLRSHTKKVGVVIWHPTASNILCSGGADGNIFIWDVESGEAFMKISLPEAVFCVSFNYNGSRLCSTSKDKLLRVIDPRTGDILKSGQPHAGGKGSQAVYLKHGKILTTGFSRSSERQAMLFEEDNLDTHTGMAEIDNSNGVIFPCYDPDTGVIYLPGKGDCLVRFYEVTDEAPYLHYLNSFNSSLPMRGFCFMPKRGLNVNSNEIARLYKLHNTGLVEVVPFTVPRKSELFQDDLYPDTAGDVPALSAEEWMQGKDADPIMISLKGGYKAPERVQVKFTRKNILANKLQTQSASSENSRPVDSKGAGEPSGPAIPPPVVESLPEDFDAKALMEDTRKLKLIVKAHERRIKSLEEKIALYEQGSSEEEEVADA